MLSLLTKKYWPMIMLPRGFVAPSYRLKSGKENCLKAEHGAKTHGRRDRAKRKNRGS